MGAFGTPEHLPDENNKNQQYQNGYGQYPAQAYQNPTSDNFQKRLRWWQYIIIVVVSIFSLFVSIGMLSQIGNSVAIGKIAAIAFPILSILLIIRYSKKQKYALFLTGYFVALIAYFSVFSSVTPIKSTTAITNNSPTAQVQNNAVTGASSRQGDTEIDYKASCTAYKYKDIARNPNNYKGKIAKFMGQVIQVQESGLSDTLRINVTKSEYGLWSDTIYVEYARKDDDESRILENDVVTIYGELNGIKDYSALLGNQVSIPYMLAKYVDIQAENDSTDSSVSIAQSAITKTKYDKLKNGMTYEQVKKIIGSDGKILSESGDKGSKYYTAIYEWSGGSAEKTASLSFIGNKLETKVEYGLE